MNTANPVIVAINDQREQLRLLSQILKLAGYQVLAFEDPLRFIESLQHSKYESTQIDLIITDLNMPRLDGWGLCRRLRSPEMSAYNHIPILVVSATFADLAAAEVRMDLGVNDFLPVPYTPEALRSKVSEILYGHSPKARPRVLLVGYLPEDGEVACFNSFGYDAVTAVDLESSWQLLGTQNVEILIFRGQLSPEEASFLFAPCSQFICGIWIFDEIDPEMDLSLSQLGVHCLTPDYHNEQLVRICENARQQSCLNKVRDLLEKRTVQLLGSEHKYRTLFQSIPDVVLCLSESGSILDVNEAGCAMLGEDAHQLKGKNLMDMVPEDGQVQVQVALHETLAHGYVQYEVNFRCGPNHLPAEIHQRKVDLAGQTCVLAIARDVSERRQCQQAVLASDTRYRIIAENTYDWEFWLSPQGFFLFSSPSAEKVSGYSSADFEDDPMLLIELVVEEDRADFLRNWKMDRPEDLPKDFEFRLLHKDGQVRWINHVSVAVFDSQNNFLGSRGNHRDVTQKRVLDQERTKLVAALEQISEAILVTDNQGIIQYVNQAFLQRSGSRPDGWVGVAAGELPGDTNWRSAVPDILHRMSGGNAWNGNYSRTGQAHYDIVATVSPVKDSAGRVTSFVWVERDVTEERRLADQLRQSQKLEAIGTLAGGIAHDFNNLLSGILGYSSMLRMQAGQHQEVAHSAEVIERTARRAADLTQKLLGFARRGKNQHVKVCLHKAIEDCIELLIRTMDKRIEIVKDFTAQQSLVMGDPTQMEQILLNLAINARDALGEKGKITFSTRTERLDSDTTMAIDGGLANGSYLVVTVADTGCGIPHPIQERIFDPFFTTKENGKGTGMGLAMVYGIVKNHEGGVVLKSAPGEGAIFDIYLPLASLQANPKPIPEPAPVKGSGLILVIDDEDLLRDVASRYLKHLGYAVVTAVDGMDAQRVYAQKWQDIDLVIIDMIMPKVGGAECFRALKKVNPAVRAVLSTGYSLNETAQEMLDDGMIGFIQKPYQLQQLSEVLARSLKPPQPV
ncbi:PAS domain S-box protein [bacterium]|nr:PAS domain S-box protein [bacterium]